MRRSIEENLLKLVRLYTFNTPIEKGKYRIFLEALKRCRHRPNSLPVKLRDGRKFIINLETGMQDQVYFVGEFEKLLTEITRGLISEGDVCIDVGANFGWYTSLMMLHGGKNGEVHAFEPVPRTFRELTDNYVLAGSPANVHLNNLALGDREDVVQIHTFEGLASGYASLAVKGENAVATSTDCRMITLDSYLDENHVGNVDFVKVDIEGAELGMLKGAERLFNQEVPPIFLMEMAVAQTSNFGYEPNDLIDLIAARGDYDFYAAKELDGCIEHIERFPEGHIGANVYCVPKNAPQHKLDLISRYAI